MASSKSRLACSINLATVEAVTFKAAMDCWRWALASRSDGPDEGFLSPKLPPEVGLGRSIWEEMAQAV